MEEWSLITRVDLMMAVELLPVQEPLAATRTKARSSEGVSCQTLSVDRLAVQKRPLPKPQAVTTCSPINFQEREKQRDDREVVDDPSKPTCSEEANHSQNNLEQSTTTTVSTTTTKTGTSVASTHIDPKPESNARPVISAKKQYTCEIHRCGKIFPQYSNYKRHVDSFHIPRAGVTFVCKTCQEALTQENELDDNDHGDDSMTCCLFTTKHDLILHEMDHHPNQHVKAFACTVAGCAKKYSRKDHLSRHLRTAHRDDTSLASKDWTDSASTSAAASIPSPTSTPYGSEKQRQNGSTSSTTAAPSSLPTPSAVSHICTMCQASFVYRHGLVRHMKNRHEKSSSKPFQCTQCLMVFKKKKDLQAHAFVHTGELPFACQLCPQRFLKHFQLNKHMERSHLESAMGLVTDSNDTTRNDSQNLHEQRVLTCEFDDCDEIFFDEASKQAHAEQIHHPTAKARSPEAKKSEEQNTNETSVIKGNSTMESEQELHHQGDGFCFMCSFCNRRFRRRRAIRLHLKTHIETLEARKLFVCGFPACGKSYTTKSNLKVHLQVAHPQQSSDETHDGEVLSLSQESSSSSCSSSGSPTGKVFTCPVEKCRRAFSYKSVLKNHLQKIHKQFGTLKSEPASKALPNERELEGQGPDNRPHKRKRPNESFEYIKKRIVGFNVVPVEDPEKETTAAGENSSSTCRDASL